MHLSRAKYPLRDSNSNAPDTVGSHVLTDPDRREAGGDQGSLRGQGSPWCGCFASVSELVSRAGGRTHASARRRARRAVGVTKRCVDRTRTPVRARHGGLSTAGRFGAKARPSQVGRSETDALQDSRLEAAVHQLREATPSRFRDCSAAVIETDERRRAAVEFPVRFPKPLRRPEPHRFSGPSLPLPNHRPRAPQAPRRNF